MKTKCYIHYQDLGTITYAVVYPSFDATPGYHWNCPHWEGPVRHSSPAGWHAY